MTSLRRSSIDELGRRRAEFKPGYINLKGKGISEINLGKIGTRTGIMPSNGIERRWHIFN